MDTLAFLTTIFHDEILLWVSIVAPNSISSFDKKWQQWDQSCQANKFNNHNPSQVDRSSFNRINVMITTSKALLLIFNF